MPLPGRAHDRGAGAVPAIARPPVARLPAPGLPAPRWAAGLLAAGLLAVGLLVPSPVLGHALLASSVPEPGASLSVPPRIVRLEFTEPLNPPFSGLTVAGPDGVVAVTVSFPQGDPRGMAGTLPVLPPGRYTVEWHTLSLIDGHTRSGAFSFAVLDSAGRLPPAPPVQVRSVATPLPGWLDAAARWALLLALAYLVGALAFAGLARGLTPRERAVPGLARTLAAAVTALLALAEGIVSEAAGSSGLGAVPSVATGTLAGQAAIVSAAAVLLLAAAVRHPAGLRALAGWVAATVAVVALAGTSHLASGPGAAWGTLVLTVHLGAALLWPGTLFHLARTWLGRRAGDLPLGTLLSRFSRLAAPSVALVLGSGLLAALVQLPDPGALVSTGYGRALVLKAGLVALLLVPAALNAFRYRPAAERDGSTPGPGGDGPRAGPPPAIESAGPPPATESGGHGRRRGLRRAIAAELVLAAAVIGVASVLGQGTPARAELATRALEQQIASNDNPANLVSSTVVAGGTTLVVNVIPGAVGPNQVDVDVPLVAGAPVPVSVQLVDPSGAAGPRIALTPGEVEQSGATRSQPYDGFVELGPLPGPWIARLVVREGGRETEVAAPLPLTALAPGPARGGGGPLDSPAPDVPPQILAGIALATLALTALAAGRTRPRTRAWYVAPPVAGAGLGVAALLVAVGLGGVPAPPAQVPATPWGIATRVEPVRSGSIVEYGIPTPESGAMIPAVAPDGHVWVGEMDGNRIAELDPRSDTIRELALGPPIRSVMGLAISPDGRAWWAEEATDQVGMLDPRNGRVRDFRLPTPDAGPVGIAVAPSGTVWITEQAGGRIAALDPATGAVREYAIPTPNPVPYWIAVAPDGRVWFTEMDGRAVGVLDPGTGAIREYRGPATQGEPVGIAVAPDGTAWFSTLDGVLGRLDPASGAVTAIDLGTHAAGYGVAIDPSGNVWLGQLGGAIARYQPATGAVSLIDLPTPDSGPWWPAVDGAGNVWVAEGALTANRLARIAP